MKESEDVMEKKMTCGGVLKKHRNKYLMIAPFFILFFTFVILPIISVVVLSFTSFNMLEFPKWIGASNYISLFVHDDVFLICDYHRSFELFNVLFLRLDYKQFQPENKGFIDTCFLCSLNFG